MRLAGPPKLYTTSPWWVQREIFHLCGGNLFAFVRAVSSACSDCSQFEQPPRISGYGWKVNSVTVWTDWSGSRSPCVETFEKPSLSFGSLTGSLSVGGTLV